MLCGLDTSKIDQRGMTDAWARLVQTLKGQGQLGNAQIDIWRDVCEAKRPKDSESTVYPNEMDQME